MHTSHLRITFAAVGLAWLVAFTSVSLAQGPSVTPGARFDMEVRTDFFAGFSGDAERLARAMARCEEVLAANPDHAEALVWHGGGVYFAAGQAFRKGDVQAGMALSARGLDEMNRAVALAPKNVAVRIPRGATLLQATRQMPPTMAKGLLELALDDYETALDLQASYFSTLSPHARGELLFGLADGWARFGNQDKARTYFTRLVNEGTGSARVDYAKGWLEGKAPANPPGCVGCHK